jgi:hypothetical protein
MKPLHTTAFIISAMAIGFAISSSNAQTSAKKNIAITFNPTLAKMQCEKQGWLYREVCIRFEAAKNCDPSLAFGCANECVETAMRCVPPGPK